MLALVMSLCLCCISPATAGDTDVDAIGRFDQEGTAPPLRVIGVEWRLDLAPPEWPGARAAALAGQAAFDAWIAASAKPLEVKAMYASLPAPWKDAVRRGALGLSP